MAPAKKNPVSPKASLLTRDDLYLFNEGSHFRLFEKLGAHPLTVNGTTGTYFAVWAPSADRVFVPGSFTEWKHESHPLHRGERRTLQVSDPFTRARVSR